MNKESFTLTLKRATSRDTDFQNLVIELDKELWNIYDTLQHEYNKYNKIEYIDTVIVAYLDNSPVGCCCFKKYDSASVEVKRMFVAEDKRGKGIASAMLNALELWAKDLNYSIAVLETGVKQLEAIKLYKKRGYSITENYGPYTGMESSICMKKQLTAL